MATLICISCQSPVSPVEVTCPGCGVLVLDGANTREVADAAPTNPTPPAPDHPAATALADRVCPHCGTSAADPAAVVCVACLREFGSAAPPAEQIGFAADSDDLTRTRRDVRISAIVLETAGGSVRLDPMPSILIGRDQQSPAGRLLAAHDNVSRRHVEIRVSQAGAWVADLGSTNGSYLDGQRLTADEPTPLTDGAHLRLASNVETVIRLVPQEEGG